MTKRERNMGIFVGGLAVLTVGWFGGRALFVAPFERQQERIKTLRGEVSQLDSARKGLRDAKKNWSTVVSRTLDMNPDRAHARFRGDVSALLEKHRFTEGELVVRQLSARKNKDLTVELPLIVTTKGKLKDIMPFLVDLLRRDYIVRIDSLALNAEQTAKPKATTGRGRAAATTPVGGDPDGPILAMALTATTLVVPKIEGVNAKPMSDITSSEKGRLPRDPAEYEKVAAVNIFSDYTPPPPVPKPPPDNAVASNNPPPGTGDQPPPTPQPPPVDVRADADHLTLVGTVSFNGQPVAWVRDDRNPTEPPARKALNEPLDDGVLVLVHPRGIVVHATRGEDAGKEFFYPYSKTFRERVPVQEAAHPDVVSALNVALGRQQ